MCLWRTVCIVLCPQLICWVSLLALRRQHWAGGALTAPRHLSRLADRVQGRLKGGAAAAGAHRSGCQAGGTHDLLASSSHQQICEFVALCSCSRCACALNSFRGCRSWLCHSSPLPMCHSVIVCPPASVIFHYAASCLHFQAGPWQGSKRAALVASSAGGWISRIFLGRGPPYSNTVYHGADRCGGGAEARHTEALQTHPCRTSATSRLAFCG